MTHVCRLAVCFLVVSGIGCSRSAPTVTTSAVVSGVSTVAAAIPALTKAATNSQPDPPAEANPPTARPKDASVEPNVAPAPTSPVPEMGDLFAPPKIVIPVVTQEPEPEPEPEPEATPEPGIEQPKKVTPLPNLRLVGFVEVEGLKALLAVEGQLNVVTIGDSPHGLRIIAIEPPNVTLRHGEDGEEFQMNLYEQPWFHPAGATAADRTSIGGQSVFQKNPSVPTTVGSPAGTKFPNSFPPFPGAAGDPVPPPPGPAGFGGSIGPPPAIPGVSESPSGPRIPGQTPPPTTKKTAKKSSRSTKDSNGSAPGMPGIPSPPGISGMPTVLQGNGAAISGADASR